MKELYFFPRVKMNAKIVDSVIDMYEDGFEIEDIKMYISDLLEIENYE